MCHAGAASVASGADDHSGHRPADSADILTFKLPALSTLATAGLPGACPPVNSCRCLNHLCLPQSVLVTHRVFLLACSHPVFALRRRKLATAACAVLYNRGNVSEEDDASQSGWPPVLVTYAAQDFLCACCREDTPVTKPDDYPPFLPTGWLWSSGLSVRIAIPVWRFHHGYCASFSCRSFVFRRH